jgi:hypothetical protein
MTTETPSHPELGNYCETFEPNYLRAAGRLTFAFLFALPGLFVILVCSGLVPLPFRDDFWQRVSAFIIVLVCVWNFGYSSFLTIRSLGPLVIVYEKGFVARGETYAWHNVNSFVMDGMEGPFIFALVFQTGFGVKTVNGQEFRFTRGLRGADDFAALIQGQIHSRLLNAAREDFVAGKELKFSKDVVIHQTGIRYREVLSQTNRDVSWEDIEEISGGGMYFRVYRIGESSVKRTLGFADCIMAPGLLNPSVFLELVSEIIAGRNVDPVS